MRGCSLPEVARNDRRLGGCAGALGLLLLLAGCGEPAQVKGPALPYTPDPPARILKEEEIPVKDDLPRVMMKTSQGDLEIVLFEDEAPNTVANFIELVEKKFYDGLKFHRIIPDFCIQGGDPKGDGSGGPGYKFKDEFLEVYHHNVYGTLSMANSGPHTNGSQFFFNVSKAGRPDLDKKHVVFGKVANKKDYEVLEKLAAVKTLATRPVDDQRILSITVLKKRAHPYEVHGKNPDLPGMPGMSGMQGMPGIPIRPGKGAEGDPIRNLMKAKDPLKEALRIIPNAPEELKKMDAAVKKTGAEAVTEKTVSPEKTAAAPEGKTDAPLPVPAPEKKP